ncbi:hypothetical protein FDECE_13748 [Fusarium decemcellulare]|nr:hypothetical protein FDECE_13748 [Fusarium decemcellulare]
MAYETAQDIYIALMGVTGSGKSTFVSHCTGQQATVGDGLQSCTRNVQIYSFSYRPGVTIHLVDTPGFDDTNKQDSEVLREISAWLSESYAHHVYLNGILYFHRISDTRMQGTGKLNIALLLKVCGQDAIKKVALTTTMWELVEQNVGEMREQELQDTPEFWGFMKKHGARVCRHYNNRESALNILSAFVPQAPNVKPEVVKLALQKELADDHKTLDQTSAGQILDTTWSKEKEGLERELAEVREAMRTATEQRDMSMANILHEQQEEMDRTVEGMKAEQEKLKVTMEELHAERLAKMKEMLEQQMNATESLNNDLQYREMQRQAEAQRQEEERLRNQQFSAEQQRTINDLAAQLGSIQVPGAAEPPPTVPVIPISLPDVRQDEGPILHLKHFQEIQILQDIVSVVFTNDGQRLIAGTEESQIWIWDRDHRGMWQHSQTLQLTTNMKFDRLLNGRRGIKALVLGPNSRSLAAASIDKTIRIFEVNSLGRFEQTQSLKDKRVKAWTVTMLALSPDGTTLLAAGGTDSQKIFVWTTLSTATMHCVNIIDLKTLIAKPDAELSKIEFSPDGRVALGLKGEVLVCAWHAGSRTLQTLYMFSTEMELVTSLSWSSDARTLAATDWNGTVWVFGSDSQGGMYLESKITDPDRSWGENARFSPDGQLLALINKDGILRIWKKHMRDGWDVVARMEGRGWSTGGTLAFHPSGEYMAVLKPPKLQSKHQDSPHDAQLTIVLPRLLRQHSLKSASKAMFDPQRLASWLETIPDVCEPPKLDPRPGKRKAAQQEPSPPASDKNSSTMRRQTPTKKRRLDDPNRTPRAVDFPPPASSASSVSWSESSDGASRSTSPKKQMLGLRLEERGLECRQLNVDTAPAVVADLLSAIREIGSGIEILPDSQRDTILNSPLVKGQNTRLWRFAFKEAAEDTLPGRIPPPNEISLICDLARQCHDKNHEEASWNMEVHHRLLEGILREPGTCKGKPFNFTTCTTARPLRRYVPYSSTAKMVDFCLYLDDGADADALQALGRRTPTLTVNHTDFAPLQLTPIVLSIETKRPGKELDAAQIQMGVWHAAQWAFLRSVVGLTPHHTSTEEEIARQQKAETALSGLGFIPGIIIQGHRWLFVFSTLEGDKTVLWTERQFGTTQSILDTYSVVAGIRELSRWTRDVYVPWFRENVLSGFRLSVEAG